MYRIWPVHRNYAWGSDSRLQSLFRLTDDGPLAELWFSGHPQFPSLLDVDGDEIDLATAIKRAPAFMAGQSVIDRWGATLPFLFKIICADRPLSLQVHPRADKASKGFAEEEARGIDIHDPVRSFKDPVAKHEMVVALEPFSASVGFLPIRRQIEALQYIDHPLADSMVTILSQATGPAAAFDKTGREGAIFQAFSRAVTSETDGGEVTALAAACQRAAKADGCPSQIALALNHARIAAEAFPSDPSIFCIAMMNPVELDQGESVFIPAGTVHTYLKGTGAEIMTNSDNVLRAGMTIKHRDIPHLLENLSCSPAPPIDPSSGLLKLVFQADVVTYKPTLEEFMLAYGHVDPKSGATKGWWTVSDRLRRTQAKFSQAVGPQHMLASRPGPRIIVCLDGVIRCRSNSQIMDLSSGQAAYIPASEPSVSVSGAIEEPGSYILASTAL